MGKTLTKSVPFGTYDAVLACTHILCFRECLRQLMHTNMILFERILIGFHISTDLIMNETLALLMYSVIQGVIAIVIKFERAAKYAGRLFEIYRAL